MAPGTDLTAVSLPFLPEGHRWVIDKNTKLRASSWGDSWSYKGLGISLQRQVKTVFGKVKWKSVSSRELDRKFKGDWVGGFYDQESLVQCAERTAQEIYDQHIKLLEQRLEEESIIGVYQDKALPD